MVTKFARPIQRGALSTRKSVNAKKSAKSTGMTAKVMKSASAGATKSRPVRRCSAISGLPLPAVNRKLGRSAATPSVGALAPFVGVAAGSLLCQLLVGIAGSGVQRLLDVRLSKYRGLQLLLQGTENVRVVRRDGKRLGEADE